MSEAPIKKQALLIGINEYQILPELKYARQDAEAVEQALKHNYCFSDDEVILLTDAKPGLFKPTNRRIIEKHLEKLADQDLDLFIFGFWGHGLFRNGQRYFCPLDAISEDIEELGLSFESLQRLLSNIKAKNTCMIFDCCQKVHDRGESEVLTAADQTVMENAARDIVLRRKEKEPDFVSNVAILNSCKEGQAAYEWDNRKHGIFTAHLLDAMNRRFDSVAQIVGYISSHVEKTAMELGKTQTPFYKLEGDISLPVDTNSSPLVTGDVFISYRHCNADLVAPVEEELKRRNISYFIDRVGVNYGMEYAEALIQAIAGCKLLLLFWTPEVKESSDIVSEVVMALQAKKKVIPYKIGNFDVFEHRRLLYHLAPLSRYDVPGQTPETVAEIVNRIEQTLTGKAYRPRPYILPGKSQNAIIQKNAVKDVNKTYTPELIKRPQELKSEPDHQIEHQANNAYNENNSKKSPVPLSDVALGVSYYFTAIIIIILTYLPGFVLSFNNAYVAGLNGNNSSAVVRGENDNMVVGFFTFLITAISVPFYVKSMLYFRKTPSKIYRNAKFTIIYSWVIWFIGYFLSFVSSIDANVDKGFYPLALNVIATVLLAFSVYMFMRFMSAIGEFCLPEKKGCTRSIVLIMVFYAMSILFGFVGSPENINLKSPSGAVNTILALIGGGFFIAGGIMYLMYINKLNKFFKTKNDIAK